MISRTRYPHLIRTRLTPPPLPTGISHHRASARREVRPRSYLRSTTVSFEQVDLVDPISPSTFVWNCQLRSDIQGASSGYHSCPSYRATIDVVVVIAIAIVDSNIAGPLATHKMPRRTTKDNSSTPQTLSKTLPPATPNPPLSPLIQILRRDWRWASISQFLWTFGQAAGLSTWDIDVSLSPLSLPIPSSPRFIIRTLPLPRASSNRADPRECRPCPCACPSM